MDFPLMTNDQRNSIDDEVARIIKLKKKMNIHRDSRLNEIARSEIMFELFNNLPGHKDKKIGMKN